MPINRTGEKSVPGAKAEGTPEDPIKTVAAQPLRAFDSAERQALFARAQRALRSFQVLLSASRLYQKGHPRTIEALDQTYDELLSVADSLNGLELRIEPAGLLLPKLSETPLPDVRGELATLAADLRRAGIHSLLFARKFHVGELDTLTHLIHKAATRPRENASSAAGGWPARLSEHRVEGIDVNVSRERQVDTVLASLIAAMVAFGGGTPRDAADETPIRPPAIGDIFALLKLLARLTPPLDIARGLAPDEAARAIHAALEQADKETVRTLLSAVSQYGPREGERPQPYLLRLSELLVLEFLAAEFAAGSLAPSAIVPTVKRLGAELVAGGGYTGPHSSQHLSSLSAEWARETHAEQVAERFWAELTPRERSLTLRGPEVWCVPMSALQRALRQLADSGADAPRREARNIVLNYVRCLGLPNPEARRAVAVGLGEMAPILESLWPNQFPEDLSGGAMKALQKEGVPEIAALLAAFLENIGRTAVARGDYAGFESILLGLESAPQDAAHDHLKALAQRLVSQDRWLLLVDASLANRPLDPVLPRLLQRDPERLLDRLTLLLTETRGQEQVPAMARLLRAIGVPALGLLETRLYEARRQRVMSAIKLLAAADPDRLLRALPRAIASWEWNLQDLAVSELSRPANSPAASSTAFVFSAILAEVHPLVVPMMIDQIGVAQESTAVPTLMEIAAGELEVLCDVFVRIKAIEALGRMRAVEALDLLRELAEKRDGLSYAEPAGLRAAAGEALALIENRPSAERVRAAYETLEQVARPFAVQRRYTRIPLDSPLSAQIEGPQMATARVRTISLGGAYLQSSRRLAVGDSIKLNIRSGLRKIQSTAVVRNLGPDGGGIEFVHMKDDDREKLRRLVQRRLHS
ncbi:MAG TPA: PilZ domain-containing protein [Methylomirabilota bacterium]|nr:PilZ domain-containing protein [Methylomirabilota bacterium]